jgi:predicted TIM-barrel fold metal-dependent hydrolase
MTSHATPRLIDFHSHYCDPAWYDSPVTQQPPALARAWPLLTDIEAQLAVLEKAGIETKVLSAPASMLVAPGRSLPLSLIERTNDGFAELIARYPGRLLGLATIDAYQGESGAREVTRAVQTLKLGGICVDCAQGDRFLDRPEAFPTLEAAAALGVPVFVHPVSPAGLTERLAPLGHTGVLLARGTEDAASLLALLRSGIFDTLPELKIVFPMIGAAVLVFAGLADLEYARDEGWQGMRPAQARTRFYVDTMGFDPAAIRFASELLGPEHVLLGSDWPIMPLTSRPQIEAKLAPLALTDEQQAGILGGNTQRLFAPTIRKEWT